MWQIILPHPIFYYCWMGKQCLGGDCSAILLYDHKLTYLFSSGNIEKAVCLNGESPARIA